MFRITCLCIALGLAITGYDLSALPATAQGTVREHGAPPAPKPTVDRDQRRGVRENDPVQWEIRGSVVNPCFGYPLFNVVRAGRGQSNMLAADGTKTGWAKDGGNWGFGLEGYVCLATTIKTNLQIWSARANRFLRNDLSLGQKQGAVWRVVRIKTVKREGVTYQRFAIFHVYERRFLMVCHDEADRKKNGTDLCLYDEP